MAFLDSIADLVLVFLTRLIADNQIGAIIWMVFLAGVTLLFGKFLRSFRI